MQPSAFVGKASIAAVLTLFLAACSTTAEFRSVSSASNAPIEVIESNYIESTNDAEIVRAESPFFFVSLGDLPIA
jgi:hypothetical protein